VTLAALEDRETVMLFWNPGCGFCQRMLPELTAWEEEAPDDAPGLLIVSTGTPEANRALGLRSPIVLDQGFSVGRAYGSSGTPSGVAIRDGQIASQLNVGAPSVFGLLRPQPSSRTA
jgi:thiol-disulfide isomerase/thioredoxin